MQHISLTHPAAELPAARDVLILGLLRALLLLVFLGSVPVFSGPAEHPAIEHPASGPGCGIAWAP